MSTSSAAQLKKIQEMMEQASKGKIKATPAARSKEPANANATKFATIEANPFYKIMFDTETSPEEKMEAVASALTFEGTKEENAEQIKAFALFKEYLQHQRKQMADEIMKLVDTGAFSELKDVIDQLNNGIIEFDEAMKPLADVVEAVFMLRTNGDDTIFTAFNEIKQENEKRKETEAKLADQERKLKETEEAINAAKRDIAVLETNKPWYKFGRISKSSQEEIARRRVDIEDAQTQLVQLAAEREQINADASAPLSSVFEGDLAKSKDTLREFLDIGSDTHKARQAELIQKARDFVKFSDERTSAVLTHLDDMSGQISNLFDANSKMKGVYAVMADGTNEALKRNDQKAQELSKEPEGGESQISRMKREDGVNSVNKHIQVLVEANSDTVNTLGDLSLQSIKINNMNDTNRTQVAKVRGLNSTGIASVADQLAVVLNGLSGAALGEAAHVAEQSLKVMQNRTSSISAKEAFRSAMGVSDETNKLKDTLDSMKVFSEIQRKSTELYRENARDLKDTLGQVREQFVEVTEAVKESIAAAAEVQAEGGDSAPANGDKPKKPAAPKIADPFKIGPK